MEIRFTREAREDAVASLQRYFADELGEEIGDLKAGLLLDHVLREIGPAIYNRAIADAQAWVHERVTDLDAQLYAPEPGPRRPPPRDPGEDSR